MTRVPCDEVGRVRTASGEEEMTTETAVKIDAKQVKELREKSGAPMGDCLKALQEAKGEMEAAFVVLRKRGMASAAKKATRTTNEGAVGTYLHAGGKIGVLVELNCESDFVARTDDFQELLRDVAMHIAATDPRFISRDEVTEADLEREKDIYRSQAAASGKPANIIEKMLEGKLGKFYEEFCLLDQPFIKDQSQTIAQIVATKVGKLGENISIRRFVRFKVGAADWTVAQTKIAAEENKA
jgi:elongation factor Ts